MLPNINCGFISYLIVVEIHYKRTTCVNLHVKKMYILKKQNETKHELCHYRDKVDALTSSYIDEFILAN